MLPYSQGGESVALARLKYYLWDSDLIATYFDTVCCAPVEIDGMLHTC